MSTRLAAPAQRTIRLVDPGIWSDHPVGARGLKSGKAESHAYEGVDRIIMDREEGALEQREMNEPHRGAQHQHVDDDLPPRTPRQGHRASGQCRRTAAQNDSDQKEYA